MPLRSMGLGQITPLASPTLGSPDVYRAPCFNRKKVGTLYETEKRLVP
jgi:hypothetical protein